MDTRLAVSVSSAGVALALRIYPMRMGGNAESDGLRDGPGTASPADTGGWKPGKPRAQRWAQTAGLITKTWACSFDRRGMPFVMS